MTNELSPPTLLAAVAAAPYRLRPVTARVVVLARRRAHRGRGDDERHGATQSAWRARLYVLPRVVRRGQHVD